MCTKPNKITLSFIALLFLLCGRSLSAQHFVGVKGGPNINLVQFSDFLINTRIGQQTWVAQHYGLSYQHFSTPHTGVQADLLYIRKGWEQRIDPNPDFDGFFRTSLDYITLPFYANLSLGKKNFKAFLLLGPFISLLINQQQELTHPDRAERVAFHFDPDEDNSFDYGIAGGLGFSYLFSFGRIQMDVTFQQSLNNILDYQPTIRDKPATSWNQSTLISASYYLPLSQVLGNTKE